MLRCLILLLILAPSLAAATQTAALCLAAAERAAARHQVPVAVMRALTRTETGRNRGGKLQPWPWTTNMEGKGVWFDSRAEAVAYIEQAQARGARSFDVGCFQLNHIYHAKPFADINHMIEPQANADYAASFIRALYEEFGDWATAAGAYHSRTPHLKAKYKRRFEQVLARGDRDDSGTMLALAEPGVIPDTPAPRAAAQRTPRAQPPRPPAADGYGRRARPEPKLWRAAAIAAPQTSGAVAVRLLRGGASPLRAAARPLID